MDQADSLLRTVQRVLHETALGFVDDRCPRMGAALAYYTLFSLAPLLLIMVSVAGLVWGQDAVRGQLAGQLTGLLGAAGAATVEQLLRSVAWPAGGWLNMIIGLLLMLVGATTVFAELQDGLDTIWKVPQQSAQGWWVWLRTRLLSFGLILGLAFLLLMSLVLSATLGAVQTWWAPWFGNWLLVAATVNVLVEQLLVVTVFALILKWMPRTRIGWRDVALGALVTAALFHLGRVVMSAYLEQSGLSSGFGAAASLVALLVWVYYSAQILLLGAEFTRAYATNLGSHRVRQDVSAPSYAQAAPGPAEPTRTAA